MPKSNPIVKAEKGLRPFKLKGQSEEKPLRTQFDLTVLLYSLSKQKLVVLTFKTNGKKIKKS